jgi:bla regulator protein blaR1
MIAWMAYTLLVSVLVVGAAACVDGLLRLARRPVRWVWLTALWVVVVLAVAAPYRATRVSSVPIPIATTSAPAVASAPDWSWRSALRDVLVIARRSFDAPIAKSVAALERRLPMSAGSIVLAAWVAVSVVLGMLGVAVHWRFGRAVRRWPVADLDGRRVRVSPSVGPVVIGFAHPEIVVPRWVLERTREEQRLVIAHEAEHVAARDAIVLAGAGVAVVLMPWNPALWVMLSRVRLAVELDCDARVLRRGIAPTTYGGLLIDLAEHVRPLGLAAAALADDASHLHKRILAMRPPVFRFARLRGGAASVAGLVGLLAACEAKLPTESDIKRMDAASAEQGARQLALIAPTDSVRYVIDGAETSEQAAKSVPPWAIATVNVSKPGGGVSTITMRLKPLGERLAEDARRRGDTAEVNGRSLIATAQQRGTTPLFIIDGVRTDQSTFSKLDRTNIEAVEVLKGKAAALTYGPDAEHGVIVVTTKAGAKKS